MPRRKHPSTLFQGVVDYQEGFGASRSIFYNLAKDDAGLLGRMKRYRVANVHNGCINSICWNDRGSCILSGSDDQHLKITDPFPIQPKILWDYKTSHKSNIFSAHFLPYSSDRKVISCSGDGLILYTDIERTAMENTPCRFNCHDGTCYKLITVPNEPHTFISCGEDQTVRFFDLRQKESCNCIGSPSDVLITTQRAVTSMAVNPLVPYYLALGVGDSSVKIYDRRKLSVGQKKDPTDSGDTGQLRQLVVPQIEASDRYFRITSLTYTNNGTQLLASYSSESLYLFDLQDAEQSKPFIVESSPAQPALEAVISEIVKDRKTPKPNLKRLRLRGDWSDTGPNARPQRDNNGGGEIAQARPTLHQSLMERMTLVLAQMLNESPGNVSDEMASNLPRTNGTNTTGSNDPDNEDSQRQTNTSADLGSAGSDVPQLEDDLASLRSSFVNRHRMEPGAVNLSYREGGGNAGLISMSVGNEFERDPGNTDPVAVDNDEPTSSSKAKKAWEKTVLKAISKFPGGKIRMKYTGHRNARTMIKEANFYGENYILSGSDCGHIFIWDKNTGQLVQILEADNHVVNNVQPHPFDTLIAASGIDYDFKIFAPISEDSTFNREVASELVKRNELMLEETKDTITVPAAFMIRMLSCLSHIRRSGRSQPRQNEAPSESSATTDEESSSGPQPDQD